MSRTKRPAHFLCILTLLACLLSILTWTTARAQQGSPPDSSTEVSGEAESTVPDQAQGAPDPQEKEEDDFQVMYL